jgi:hypothetical protein
LKKAAQGQSIDHITLSVLAPASAKNVEKPKTKMTVTSRKDYPEGNMIDTLTLSSFLQQVQKVLQL